MSETRATTTADQVPVFPPGRYGHRREGRPRRTVPFIIMGLVIVAALALTIKLYEEYGQTAYQSQIIGWDPPTATQILIKFSVTVPAGKSAQCTLRARDYGGNDLGERTVVVHPVGDATSITAKEAVTTTAKASVGDVLGCRATG